MPFTIIDLPGTMAAQGFAKGAALMRRWFAGSARTMSDAEKRGQTDPRTLPAQYVDEHIVTMDWLLRFPRAEAVHRALLDEWNKDARAGRSRDELVAKLRSTRQGQAVRAKMRFGDLSQPAKVIDQLCQMNLQRLSSSFLDPIDDLFAAIANASIKIAASGTLEPMPGGRVRMTIDEVGTYLRDTYDFNGDQPLGSWGRNGFSRMAVLAAEIPIDPATADNDGWLGRDRYYSVSNGSFRAYRDQFHRGCDFLIFSDVRRTKLSRPVVHEVML